MDRVQAYHPNWSGHLLLSEDGTALHEGHTSRGRYERNGAHLTVRWELFAADEFVMSKDIYYHVDLHASLPALERLGAVKAFGQPLRASRLTLALPTSGHEVTLRLGTSDVMVFKQVFADEEYASAFLPAHAATIIDLGANIGLATVYLGQRYPQAQIFAVEPAVDNVALLRANTAPFGDRVRCENAAVWKSDGRINLHVEDDTGAHLGAWGVQTTESETGSAGLVQSYRMDTLIDRSGFASVDILKVDIEGAELEVFTYGADAWLDKVRLVIVETHDRFRPGSDAAVRGALAASFEELPAQGENLFFRHRALT